MGHVYFGGATVDLAGWNGAITHPARIDLFNPDGLGARFASAAGWVGDINGDGLSDFAVGTSFVVGLITGGGAAHVYLGATNADVTRWNGEAPALRIDLTNPGRDVGFGNAVARAERDAAGQVVRARVVQPAGLRAVIPELAIAGGQRRRARDVR